MNTVQPPVTADVVPKAEFAAIAGVHKSRVSHWIAEGKLTGDALVGKGREQRIHVETAKAQLRQRLNIVQMTGNGLGTRLEPTSPAFRQAPSPALESAPLPPGESIQDKIMFETLETKRLQRRRLEEEERARSGLWMDAEAARRQMGRIAGDMVTAIEGGLPEMATDLALLFKLPQRDVLHGMRNSFLKLRGRISARLTQAAALPPELIEDVSDSVAERDAVNE